MSWASPILPRYALEGGWLTPHRVLDAGCRPPRPRVFQFLTRRQHPDSVAEGKGPSDIPSVRRHGQRAVP